MVGHRLAATRATTHWGFFDATLRSVHEIESGDVITIDTINGGPELLPIRGFHVLADYAEVHDNVSRRLPGHIMTGPVAVRGARPGDTLEIEIEAIDLRQDWGFTVIRPLEGALPHDFHSTSLSHIPLDRTRKVATMSWGAEIPLCPFLGVMGVAPPKAWGTISSVEPRRHGGNIDNKELIAGTKLFLPVHVDGALFSCGDGHAAQGDGEVCVSAIETSLTGRFRLKLNRDLHLEWPLAETPSHMITMAFDPDLGTAARIAVRCMLDLLVGRKGLSREDAYMLCSLAADVRVTQMVNNQNGIHVMLEKRYFA
jgi:acetamidase/formamidase